MVATEQRLQRNSETDNIIDVVEICSEHGYFVCDQLWNGFRNRSPAIGAREREHAHRYWMPIKYRHMQSHKNSNWMLFAYRCVVEKRERLRRSISNVIRLNSCGFVDHMIMSATVFSCSGTMHILASAFLCGLFIWLKCAHTEINDGDDDDKIHM